MHATENAACGFAPWVGPEPSARTAARGAATVWRTMRDEVGMVGLLAEVRDMQEYKSSRCATFKRAELLAILWTAGGRTQRVSQAGRGIVAITPDIASGRSDEITPRSPCRRARSSPARPCTYTPARAASIAESPCASNAPITPASTSPLPAVP